MKLVKKGRDFDVFRAKIGAAHPGHGGPCRMCGAAGVDLYMYGARGRYPLARTVWHEQPFCSEKCAEDFGLAPFME